MPKELCVCDLFDRAEKRNHIIVETITKGITSTKHKKRWTILRGTDSQEILNKLQKMFNTHGFSAKGEIRLSGDFSKEIRQLIHTFPSLFLFFK